MAGEGQAEMSQQMQEFLAMQSAQQQMQQTVSGITIACWDKCIGTPGRSLSSREEACLSDCAKRFIETTQFVIQRFQQKAGGGGL